MRLSHLSTSAALAVLLAACGGNGGSGDGDVTNVDEATASDALSALHLSTSGEGVVSWDEREFDDGVYTFTGVVFTDTSDADDDDDADEEDEDGAEFDSIRAERMILAAPRFDDDGNVIFDRLSIEDATFVSEEGEESSGGFDRFLVEGPNALMVADFARGFSGEEMDDDEDVNFSAYRFETFALEGLNIASTEDGEDFDMSMTRFAMENYEGERLGRFEISGVGFNGESADTGPIEFAFDEMVIENIGPSLMNSFDRGIADAMATEIGENVTEEPDDFDPEDYNPFDAYESFRFTGLNANIGGIRVTMDSMTAEVDENADEVIMTSEITPLVVRPDTEQPLGAQMAMGLGMLGYQQIEIHGESEAVYDRDEDRVYSRGENYFEMTDGFRIEAESDFGGYMAYAREAMRVSMGMQPDDFDGEDVMAMFDPLTINRFVLSIEDHSLLDRALTAGSAAQGMSKAELRQQAGAMISLGMMGMPAEIPRPLLTELSTALVEFINEGGSITITIDPDEPVSVGELVRAGRDGSFDYDAYGVTIAAEPAED